MVKTLCFHHWVQIAPGLSCRFLTAALGLQVSPPMEMPGVYAKVLCRGPLRLFPVSKLFSGCLRLVRDSSLYIWGATEPWRPHLDHLMPLTWDWWSLDGSVLTVIEPDMKSWARIPATQLLVISSLLSFPWRGFKCSHYVTNESELFHLLQRHLSKAEPVSTFYCLIWILVIYEEVKMKMNRESQLLQILSYSYIHKTIAICKCLVFP